MGQKSTPQTSSQAGRINFDQANEQLTVNDMNNNPVGLFGLDSAGNIVVKVAKSGQNVITAPSNELIFNSEQDTFKIVKKISGSFSITSSGGGVGVGTLTLIHNMGYVPLVQSTVQITSDWNGLPGIFPVPYFIPNPSSGVAGGSLFLLVSYVRVKGINTGTITYEIGEIAGGTTIAGTVTAYILQETAT